MFVSLSKTFAKFGNIRIGAGIRMNKNNSFWILLILGFIGMIKLTWYILLFFGWITYALGYGIYCLIKFIINKNRDSR